MVRATKVRIYPTQKQAEFLIAQFGAVRFAYNKALHIKTHMYRRHGVSLNPKLKARYPQFKRRRGKQSSYHCVGVKVLNGAVKLPKMTPIEANIHRDIIGKIKSITVSLNKTGKFYASILINDGK